MLAPDRHVDGVGYALFLQCDGEPSDRLALTLECELSVKPQYRYCVSLGQLQSARVFRVANDAH